MSECPSSLIMKTNFDRGSPLLEEAIEIRALLHHSWQEIDFAYDELTEQERAAISRRTFEKLVEWVKGSDK